MQAMGATVQKKYIGLVEAAEYTGMGISTLRRKISLGLLPAYKPGKTILIDPKELELFIRKSKRPIAS